MCATVRRDSPGSPSSTASALRVAGARTVTQVPYLLALASSLLWGAGDFLGGTLTRRLPAAAVVGVSQALALVAFAVSAVVVGEAAQGMPAAGWLWSAAAGVAGTAGLIAFYSALAAGTMGVVAPIAALGVVVPLAAGLLEGERPSVLQLVGACLGVLGGVLASGPDLAGHASRRPVLLAMLAGFGFGLTLLFLARGSEDSPLLTLVGMRATSVTVLVLTALVARSIGGVRRRDLPLLGVIGVLDGGANLMYAIATTAGLLSLVSVLASLYPAVTVMLARIVHHERMTRVQDVGVVAAVAGVVLVAAG
jgi:drug/metabolite transporter (DMT)-like permease